MEMAEIQASLQSPLFSRQVEGGDCLCHSDLISKSPVMLHCSPYISSPGLIYRRHLMVCLCDLLFL